MNQNENFYFINPPFKMCNLHDLPTHTKVWLKSISFCQTPLESLIKDSDNDYDISLNFPPLGMQDIHRETYELQKRKWCIYQLLITLYDILYSSFCDTEKFQFNNNPKLCAESSQCITWWCPQGICLLQQVIISIATSPPQ